MSGVLGFGIIVDAVGLFALGVSLGFFVRSVLKRHIDGDLIKHRNEKEAAQAELEAVKAELTELKPQLTNLNKLRTALEGEEDELWQLHGVDVPGEVRDRLRGEGPKIVTVMNLKGGVGKTTTVANLAAHFGQQGKRVLVIDMDYQGSLSRMMLVAASARVEGGPRAIEFLKSGSDAEALARQTIPLGTKLPNIDLISNGQQFDRFESRQMLRWLIGDESDDVRFRLARVLASDAFKQRFDVVMIDAPPRMSMGAMNALAASHVVLIPTVLDRLSAEAIGNFIARLNTFRPLSTALDYVGVIGTLRGQLGGADVTEGARTIALQGIANWIGTSHLFERDIQYFTQIARSAGGEIAYLSDKTVRQAYMELAEELEREIRL